ncbi:unnamed protein product [Rotaria sp. Silwood2]|nr:unnamed protein product [Rotaria sp. Silwood2]CAF2763909.1 unnamed protein product [Rotaria sp. Silwood2]CAF3029592.1 unnamed protein product [Rotaria sp. Silwood2]CAF3958426.1 unnamed protein product [Rotaria sp. Silwood2]CAF4325566.1 unnamed protein product [Rotaria sp. Silwood2]
MLVLSSEILNILVLVAVILAGITFIAVSIVIICFLCIKYRSPKITTDEEHLSVRSPTSHSSRSSPAPSPSSLSSSSSLNVSSSTKTPVLTVPKKKQPPIPLTDFRSDRISVIDEVTSDDEIEDKRVNKHDKNYDTIVRNDTRVNTQRYIHRQQQEKPITDVRVINRHTPYPDDVIQRERVMIANRGLGRSTIYDQ